MPINPSAAGRVRRGKGEGDTPWSNIIAFPPSSKDLCSLFFFFFFSFLSHRQICRTRRQRSRWNASIDGSKSGSLAPKSANDRYRVWDSWNTAFFTCFAATLSIIYWMLEFICGSRAIRKKNDGNDGTIEISRYRACSHLHLSRETLCLSLVSSFIVPVYSIVAILARGKKANMRFRGSASRNAWKYWCMQLAGRVKKKLYLQCSIILNHLNCYLLAISQCLTKLCLIYELYYFLSVFFTAPSYYTFYKVSK